MKAGRRSIFLVGWREITERSRSRAFLISTLAIVAVVPAGVLVPALNDRPTRVRAGITGAMPAALERAWRDGTRAGDERLELRRYPTVAAGETAVRDGDADVLVVGGERVVWKTKPDAEIAAIVTGALQRARFSERTAALGITAEQAATLLAPVPARTLDTDDPDRKRARRSRSCHSSCC